MERFTDKITADKRIVDAYLDTVDRMEKNIHMVDAGAYYASASISLKRIADSLEAIEVVLNLFLDVRDRKIK